MPLMITFAQTVPGLDVPDPRPLPDPSLLEHYLFESPAVPCTLFLVVAAAAWVFLGPGSRRAKMIALPLLACAVGVLATAWFVTTPREAMLDVTRRLIGAVSRGDGPGVGALLTGDARLYYFEATGGLEKEAILQRVERQFGPGGSLRLKDTAILRSEAAEGGDGAGVVQVKVRAMLESAGTVGFSWWRLDLVQESGQWRVRGVMPLSITGVGNATGR